MVLRVQARKTATKFDLNDYQNLEQLASALEVVLPDGCEPVFIGQLPPANLALRWQETDVTGSMVGQLKSWSGSQWV